VFIAIRVPALLRNYCGGLSELSTTAETVREALDQLERLYPSLYRNICDETGAVRRHLNVFINSDHIRDRNGLDTMLRPNDVITILPAVSGG
jgi:MoaD family protein